MRGPRLTGTILLGLGASVLQGCTELDAPTTLADPPTIASDFINGPESAGPFVIRFESEGFLDFIFFGVDPVRRLVSINALGTLDPAQSVICGGAATFDVLHFQAILNPTEAIEVLARGVDVTQHVYDLDEGGGWFNQASLCDSLQLPRLAQGTGSFRYTDNDFPVSGNGANAFGWRAEGTLEDLVNGGRIRYTEEQTALNLPDGTFKGFLVENILLRPIG